MDDDDPEVNDLMNGLIGIASGEITSGGKYGNGHPVCRRRRGWIGYGNLVRGGWLARGIGEGLFLNLYSPLSFFCMDSRVRPLVSGIINNTQSSCPTMHTV